jgi:hypothetical protein
MHLILRKKSPELCSQQGESDLTYSFGIVDIVYPRLATLEGEWHELETKRERAKKRKKPDTVLSGQ